MTTPKKTIAQYAFDGARRFNLAAKNCGFPIESIVLYAFSIEVCFKAIVMHESQVDEVQGGHHLEKLFSQLKGHSQERVRAIVDNPNFDKKLVEVSKAFVDWRYVYEAQAAGKEISAEIDFLRNLSNAAIEVANTIIPPP